MYLANIKAGSNHNFKVNYKFVGREDEIPKFDLSFIGAFDHSKSMILSLTTGHIHQIPRQLPVVAVK